MGGSGVQRPVKQVKYFRKKGWKVDVVSVKDIIFNSFDETLLDDCGDFDIFRTKTFDPMGILYLFQKSNSVDNKIYNGTKENLKSLIRTSFPVDEKIGWFLPAVWKCLLLIGKNNYDLIFSSCLPASSGLIAYFLSEISGIKFAVDFRDLYFLNPYPRFLTPLHKFIGFQLEKRLMIHAEFIVTSTRSSRDDLMKLYGKRYGKKIIYSYNGWDEDDFKSEVSSNSNKFTIRFTGNLYSNQTSLYFVKALKKIKKDNPELLENVAINFVGNYFANEAAYLSDKEFKELIEITPQVEHRVAIEKMQSADLLLIFLSSVKSDGVVPGKLFEYLRSGRPIFGMVPPQGECAELMLEHGHELICPQENVDLIIKNLKKILTHKEYYKLVSRKFNPQYCRRNQMNAIMERIEC